MYKNKLKSLRERIGNTQIEIANLLGIDRSQYGHYENEYVTIPIKHLITLCNYYKVSLDYVFSFTETRNYKIINLNGDKILSGKRLKEFRKNEKLTQTKLSNYLNTTFSTISSYERGINMLSTNYLYAICSKYKISADYLLARTDTPKKTQ